MERWTSEAMAFPHYGEGGFARVDLEFEDIQHDGPSVSVLLYLNNESVDADTGHDSTAGFAGELSIFGHGDCWGDAGHCHVPDPVHEFDRRAAHPLEPMNLTVEITDALTKIQAETEVRVTALAFGSDDADAAGSDLLRFGRLTLAIYE